MHLLHLACTWLCSVAASFSTDYFHIYDIVVVKMGYLDTHLTPETAYHTMSLTDGTTIQRSESIPFKRICCPMWPIDDIGNLSYIERT